VAVVLGRLSWEHQLTPVVSLIASLEEYALSLGWLGPAHFHSLQE
jgi:hypothetical protein